MKNELRLDSATGSELGRGQELMVHSGETVGETLPTSYQFYHRLHVSTIVLRLRLSFCPLDHLIHRSYPSHMSEHIWVKRSFLS